MGKTSAVGAKSARASRQVGAGGHGRFGPSQAKVGADPDLSPAEQRRVLDLARGIIGPKATVRDIASITGAPDNALVGVRDLGRGRVELNVRSPDLNSTQILSRNAQGKLAVYVDWFGARTTGKGLASRVIGRQVEQAARLGAENIKLSAARGPAFNGYYSWARLGFDARIPPTVRASLPAGLRGAKMVSDLMRTGAGRDAWRQHGTTTEMTFDLRAGSRSRRILAAYLREAGIK